MDLPRSFTNFNNNGRSYGIAFMAFLSLVISLFFSSHFSALASKDRRTGMSGFSIREIGPAEVPKDESPAIESLRLKEPSWNVAIYHMDSEYYFFLCGGVLINSRFVLSSAKCLHNINASEIRIRDGNHIFHKIGSIVSMEDCRNGFCFNDIALVQLEQSSTVKRILTLITKERIGRYVDIAADEGGYVWITDWKFAHELKWIGKDKKNPGVLEVSDTDADGDVEFDNSNMEAPVILQNEMEKDYKNDVVPTMKASTILAQDICEQFFSDYFKNFFATHEKVGDGIEPRHFCVSRSGTKCEKCRGHQLLIANPVPLSEPNGLVNFFLLGSRVLAKELNSTKDSSNQIELYTNTLEKYDWITSTLQNAN